jgi:hypothetical protein
MKLLIGGKTMHKLITEEGKTSKSNFDNQVVAAFWNHDTTIHADLDHGTTICIPFHNQLLSIKISPDYIDKPTINVTLVTKED